MIAPRHNDPRISVVIPVLNASAYLPDLLPAILGQKNADIHEILLVDSMSTDATVQMAAGFDRTHVLPIQNFSHGRARNVGAAAATGDIVAFLSQDALPADEDWAAQLVAPLGCDDVVASFSRQKPRPDAPPMERYFLQMHFPETNRVYQRREKDSQLAFKRDVFFSNVSAAVVRTVLREFPFDEELIMSEDQQFARDILAAGHAFAYQAASVVFHSHRYSLAGAFRRYFDSVYSLTKLFDDHDMKASASMGLKYLGGEAGFIARRYPLWLPYYFCYTAMKTLATILGHHADRLPRRWVRRMSMHSYYWADSQTT